MPILRLPANNLPATFSLTEATTPLYSMSSVTTPVPCVRAFVTSLLHLSHLIRHDFGFFPSFYRGSLIYLNKSGRVDILNQTFLVHLPPWSQVVVFHSKGPLLSFLMWDARVYLWIEVTHHLELVGLTNRVNERFVLCVRLSPWKEMLDGE